MDMEIIPTPLAVFEACELLSRGTSDVEGLGEVMAYDLGGATTDVYSMADGAPKSPNAFISGITERFAKRTVEGDVGMRYSQAALFDLILEDGLDNFCAAHDIDKAAVAQWMTICAENPGVLPLGENAAFAPVDNAFAAEAIRISALRHAGYTERVFTPSGEVFSQHGKDLTGVKYIVGSGGAVINAANPAYILRNAVYNPRDLSALKPLRPKMLLDKTNCLAAMGLLGRFEAAAALAIMKDSFVEV